MRPFLRRTTSLLFTMGVLPMAGLFMVMWLIPGEEMVLAAFGMFSLACLPLAGLAGVAIHAPYQRFITAFNDLLEGKSDASIRLPESLHRIRQGIALLLRDQTEARERLEELVRERTALLETSREALHRANGLLGAVFNDSPDGLLVTDCQGKTLMESRGYQEMFAARENETSLDRLTRQHPGLQELANASLSRPDSQGEITWVTDSQNHFVCQTVPVSFQGEAPFARLWIVRDNTENRLMEQRLRQAHKMEAVGQLAGGIAHDFNNLLTIINGNLDIMQIRAAKQGTPDPAPQLAQAIEAGRGAARLVRQLLGYSRHGQVLRELFELPAMVEETALMVRGGMPSRIRVTTHTTEEGPLWVNADASQISQMLVNLCFNARDAIKGSGSITINCETRPDPGSPTRPDHAPASSAGFAVIRVRDNGGGVPVALRERIFEPFFTTKERSRGTGLGLAMCYGLATQHGGWLDFDSEDGVGSEFRLWLPRSLEGPPVPVKATSLNTTMPRAGSGKAAAMPTILVVDDEIQVRAVSSAMLRHLGYRVVEAEDGIIACEYLSHAAATTDLMLLDINMPRRDGRETLRWLYQEKIRIPVVLCSGYVSDVDELSRESGGLAVGALQKPFSPDALAQVVRRCLDQFNTPLPS